MGMSQMCTGAGDYFRRSKPHSGTLRVVLCYVDIVSVAAHLTSMRGSLALPDGLWPRSLETLSDIEMRIYDWDEDYFRPRINFI